MSMSMSARLLAVANDDKVNMLTALFGKRMGAKKTVLRLHDTSAVKRSQTIFRKNLAYDLLLSLDDLAAEEIVKVARQSAALGVENFAEGKVQMRRFKLEEGGPFTGNALCHDLRGPSIWHLGRAAGGWARDQPWGSRRSSGAPPKHFHRKFCS